MAGGRAGRIARSAGSAILLASVLTSSSGQPPASRIQVDLCAEPPQAGFYISLDDYAEKLGMRPPSEDVPAQTGDIGYMLAGEFISALDHPSLGVDLPVNPDVVFPPDLTPEPESQPNTVHISCKQALAVAAEVYYHEMMGHAYFYVTPGTEVMFPVVAYTLQRQDGPEPAWMTGEDGEGNDWYIASAPGETPLALNDEGGGKIAVYRDGKEVSELETLAYRMRLQPPPGAPAGMPFFQTVPLYQQGVAELDGRYGKLILPIAPFDGLDGKTIDFQPSNELMYRRTEGLGRLMQAIGGGGVMAEGVNKDEGKSNLDFLIEQIYSHSIAAAFGMSNYTNEMEEIGKEAASVYDIVGDEIMLDLIYGLNERSGLTVEEGLASLSASPETAMSLVQLKYERLDRSGYEEALKKFIETGEVVAQEEGSATRSDGSIITRFRYFEQGFHLDVPSALGLAVRYDSLQDAAMDGKKMLAIEKDKEAALENVAYAAYRQSQGGPPEAYRKDETFSP